jgi:hypothetical protein
MSRWFAFVVPPTIVKADALALHEQEQEGHCGGAAVRHGLLLDLIFL